jgi:hypothetical protein
LGIEVSGKVGGEREVKEGEKKRRVNRRRKRQRRQRRRRRGRGRRARIWKKKRIRGGVCSGYNIESVEKRVMVRLV